MDEALYARCIEEEAELRFATVTQEKLFYLGLKMVEVNKQYPGSLAVRIELNGKEIFAYYPDGTGAFHEKWLKRKANMVQMMEMSSLHAFFELQKNGEEMEKDWILERENYAACGGGFPIRLESGIVVGAICVSGLPHLQDHTALIQGIRSFFEENRGM